MSYNRKRVRVLNAAVVAAFTMFLVYVTWLGLRRIERQEFSDFTPFYRAAGALAHGTNPYVHVDRRPYIYPPLLAFLYVSLAKLSEPRAAEVALLVNVAALAASVLVLVRTFATRLGAARAMKLFPLVCLIALIPVADKVKSDVRMFQTNPLILLCFALALATLDAAPLVAGVALGFAFNIKYTAVAFLPYLLLRKRWTAAAGFALGVAGFALLPAIESGWHQNLQNLAAAFGGLANGLAGQDDVMRYQGADVKSVVSLISVSITSAMARAFEAGGAPRIISVVATLVATTAICAFVTSLYRRNRLPLLHWPPAPRQANPPYCALTAIEWTGMAVAAIAFSPQTNTRHLVLALVPAALAAVLIVEPPAPETTHGAARRGRAAVAIALLLILLGLSLPPKTEHPPIFMTMTRAWFRWGGPCWSLVAAFCLTLPAALREAARSGCSQREPAAAAAGSVEPRGSSASRAA
jgi:hypothetical protein